MCVILHTSYQHETSIMARFSYSLHIRMSCGIQNQHFFEKCWYQYFTRKIANNFYAIPLLKGNPCTLKWVSMYAPISRFSVKRNEQCVLKRLINNTYLFEMYDIFNHFTTSFILNSPWSYIRWLRAYISVLLTYICMTSLSHFQIFCHFSDHIKGQWKRTRVVFVFGIVLMWKILYAFNALLQGAAPLSGGTGYIKQNLNLLVFHGVNCLTGTYRILNNESLKKTYKTPKWWCQQNKNANASKNENFWEEG